MLERGYVPADTRLGGIEVRSPLRDYQSRAVDYMMERPRSALFLDLGLGKTRIVLEALRRISEYPALVIAPLSVARSTWPDEVAKWSPFKVSIIVGTPAQRKAALKAEAHIYVINRENTKWLIDNYDIGQFKHLIIDESSSFKNPAAKRFRALAKPAQAIPRLTLLSATPAPNDLGDLWSQMWLIDGGERLGRTLTEFRREYCYDREVSMGVRRWFVKPERTAALREKIRDVCLHMSAADMLGDMPPLSVFDRPVALPEAALTALEGVAKGADPDDRPVESAGREMQLRLQIANGGYYGADAHVWRRIHDAKFDSLMELLEAAGEPAVVMYNYHPEAKMIADEIDRVFGAGGAAIWRAGGGDILRRWNAGELRAIVAHPSSIAHGVNLQAGGALMVWLGPTYSLENWQQGIGRLHRQGQAKPVRVYVLTGTDFERDALRLLGRKEMTQDALLARLKERLCYTGGAG